MKVLAVCGFGVGSSMILAMSIQKVAKKLGVDVEVENTDISTARSVPCDAIFTSKELSQELSGNVNCPVFAVQKYMDLNEVESVFQAFLESKRG